ncbi:MAG: patatin-like phospholipase family protein [Rhizobiaceae bacterium]
MSRPRRILSLDGGGLRGVASLAFLERLEAKLKAEHGPQLRLHEHFDLVGGTSTGAIIATSIALGLTLAETKEHYFRLAPNVFRRTWARIPLVRALFSAEALHREFLQIMGERTLDSPDLKTGLAVIAKRVDTGSVWFLTNNPKARYWEDSPGHIGNRHYSLANVVRASTAAPHFFDPQLIEIVKGAPPGLFVDGGVSPHNNPSLALLQIATIPAFGYGWKSGAERLDITSIGTGTFRYRMTDTSFLSRLAAPFAVDSLRSMMSDNDTMVLTLMQSLGRSETPWVTNSEVGDLNNVCIAAEPLFNFRRYDIVLEQQWLKEQLGHTVPDEMLPKLRDMSSLSTMQTIYSLAQEAAAKQIPL